MPIPVTPQNENRLEKEGLDSIAAISDAMSSNGEHAFKAGNGPAFGEIRDRDYIIVQGRTYTIDGLRGHFSQIRREAFDVPIEQRPLMRESEASLTKLNENEAYLYDSSPYDFDNPLADKRIKSRFEFMGNFLMGIGHAVDLVMAKKRQITSEYADVNVEWQRVYAQSLNEHGSDMGKSDAMRNAWMTWRYPALSVGHQMYGDFLDEIQSELDRLEARRQITSRALSAFDSDARQRNLFGDYKDEGSIR